MTENDITLGAVPIVARYAQHGLTRQWFVLLFDESKQLIAGRNWVDELRIYAMAVWPADTFRWDGTFRVWARQQTWDMKALYSARLVAGRIELLLESMIPADVRKGWYA